MRHLVGKGNAVMSVVFKELSLGQISGIAVLGILPPAVSERDSREDALAAQATCQSGDPPASLLEIALKIFLVTPQRRNTISTQNGYNLETC